MPHTKNTVGKRVQALRKERNMSQGELADKAGLKQPTISSLERGKSHTSGSLASIAAALGVSALWLETGLGDRDIAKSKNFVSASEGTEFYEVPILEAKGSCGNGKGSYLFGTKDEYGGTINKEGRWFLRHNARHENVFALMADGESMKNFIMDGDVCFFNRSIGDLRSGEIYVLDTPEGLRIKRVYRRADGYVTLMSDNPDKTIYPDELYSPEQAETLTIKGRFICREG